MKAEVNYLIEPVYSPIENIDDEERCVRLLVFMTNEFIEHRNVIFDCACIQSTMKIEDKDDKDYVKQMDKKIKMVKKFLYKK
jgi:hypothetical protein